MDFDEFIKQQLAKADEPITGEFLYLGDRILNENPKGNEVSNLCIGMSLASMYLCREFSPDGYQGFLLAVKEFASDELDREQDKEKESPPLMQ